MLSQVFDKFVSRIGTDVKYPHVSVDLVSRCIAVKAHETLAAIVQLVGSGKSYSAITLLRPMCEELIFLRYLKVIPNEDAEEYLHRRGDLEILQGLKAQEEFFPRAAQMFSFDDIPEFEPRPQVKEELDSRIYAQKKELKELGKKVGWGNSPKPSARYMAEKTDDIPVYDFFYHASSSAVPASLHHLLRMVWGDSRSGTYSISSHNFEQYYSRFALVYGSWLASDVMMTISSRFPNEWPEEEEDSFSILLALFVKPAIYHRAPKIVTKEELR